MDTNVSYKSFTAIFKVNSDSEQGQFPSLELTSLQHFSLHAFHTSPLALRTAIVTGPLYV